MYVKIINPATNGRKVYANKGSARRTTNYLVKEAKQHGQVATFFSSADKGLLGADEVVSLLDGNQNGAGKDAAKFYSLVLSPSSEELGEMGNDSLALQRYTQRVLDLYAKNFNLKDGRELQEADLVWAATIHQERKNRGTDDGMQCELKPGLQTHVHIIASARDVAQEVTLNPLAAAGHFNRVQFQAQAGVQLDEEIGRNGSLRVAEKMPSRAERVAEKARAITEKAAAQREKKVLTPAQLVAKDARLMLQVSRINTRLDVTQQLEAEQVQAAARMRGYDQTFFTILGRVEQKAAQKIYIPSPYEYLRTGRVQQAPRLQEQPALVPIATELPPPMHLQPAESRTAVQPLERLIAQLDHELAAEARAQSLRREHANAAQVVTTSPVIVPVAVPVVAPIAAPVIGPVVAPMAVPVAVPVVTLVVVPVVAPAMVPITAVVITSIINSAPTFTVDLSALLVPSAQAVEPIPATVLPASEPPLSLGELLARGKAEKQAVADQPLQDAGWDARRELEDQTRQRVATAEATALRTGASFAYLLAGQGLKLEEETATQPAGVRHLASKELFSLDKIPVSAAAQAVVGREQVQYGSVWLGDNGRGSMEEQLDRCRTYLEKAGITVNEPVPSSAGQKARLDYCFNVEQADQAEIAVRLNHVQGMAGTYLQESPHALHDPTADLVGLAVTRRQWPEREGQFNQALLVFDLQNPDSPRLADVYKNMLLADGASVGKVLDNGRGQLELPVHYHTHSPGSGEIEITFNAITLSKGEVRQSAQASEAHSQGIATLKERAKESGIRW
ncbi:DUF5712 family protein [Hymenobacter psoromatis]|uniref:DUF5712 family protein n=1 Tax=Hymenobacter psoromatis TaxID=1484116 RepID=UPI001CBB27B8|nr:DUF5712 family protein [Hymenobacter psoromatis]